MTKAEKILAKNTIQKVAAQNGVTVAECRKEIQETIDEAWEKSRVDPDLQATWNAYFPSGTKPTVEEFIVRLAGLIG